jgi:hypothetical protein
VLLCSGTRHARRGGHPGHAGASAAMAGRLDNTPANPQPTRCPAPAAAVRRAMATCKPPWSASLPPSPLHCKPPLLGLHSYPAHGPWSTPNRGGAGVVAPPSNQRQLDTTATQLSPRPRSSLLWARLRLHACVYSACLLPRRHLLLLRLFQPCFPSGAALMTRQRRHRETVVAHHAEMGRGKNAGEKGSDSDGVCQPGAECETSLLQRVCVASAKRSRFQAFSTWSFACWNIGTVQVTGLRVSNRTTSSE